MESNHRHEDFQSSALPTELQSQKMAVRTGIEPAIFCVTGRRVNPCTTGPWLREKDLNLRPSGYEPNELPSCSIPRYILAEEKGFEPLRRFHDLSVFKTDPFNRTWVFLHLHKSLFQKRQIDYNI